MEMRKLHAIDAKSQNFKSNYEEAMDDARETVIHQLEVNTLLLDQR